MKVMEGDERKGEEEGVFEFKIISLRSSIQCHILK